MSQYGEAARDAIDEMEKQIEFQQAEIDRLEKHVELANMALDKLEGTISEIEGAAR